MKPKKQIVIIIVPKEGEMPKREAGAFPQWMQMLAFWLYVRAMRPPLEKEIALLRTLIVVTILLLVILALIAVGASDVIADVLKAWPTLP